MSSESDRSTQTVPPFWRPLRPRSRLPHHGRLRECDLALAFQLSLAAPARMLSAGHLPAGAAERPCRGRTREFGDSNWTVNRQHRSGGSDGSIAAPPETTKAMPQIQTLARCTLLLGSRSLLGNDSHRVESEDFGAIPCLGRQNGINAVPTECFRVPDFPSGEMH